MTPPRPTALRLWTRSSAARAPKPPLSLSAWSPTAEALAVLLDATDIDADDPGAFAEQIPHATQLREATPVFVLGEAVRSRGTLRWLGARTVAISRLARCTALVARGYVGVGAGVDAASGRDLAWGVSSPC